MHLLCREARTRRSTLVSHSLKSDVDLLEKGKLSANMTVRWVGGEVEALSWQFETSYPVDFWTRYSGKPQDSWREEDG